MRKITPEPTRDPRKEETTVVLTGREIQIVTAALLGQSVKVDGNVDLWAEFDELRVDNELARIDGHDGEELDD